MKIGLLKCDTVMPEFHHIAGDYTDMFRDLFSEFAPDIEFTIYDVEHGEYPASPDEMNGYLATGSKLSVYNNVPWIHQYRDFIKEINEKKIKFAGICFGHQMIACALGGRSEKSDKGWGVGIKKINIVRKMPWMDPPMEEIDLLVTHQDQVVEIPPGALVLGENSHCPYGIYQVENHILSIQSHPEFTVEFVKNLITSREDRIGRETLDKAMESLQQKPNRKEITEWIANFLRD